MKVIKRDEVSNLIKDNDSVMIGGFIGTAVPEDLLVALQENYLKNQTPKDLSIIFCAGVGDGKERGINHLAEEGMVKKAVGGHFGLSPRLTKLINENKVEGYNLPQGIMAHLIRATAAKVPFIVSTVGLQTFVDPRLEGGQLNEISNDKRVELLNIDNMELLKFKSFKPNVAIMRGTYSDKKGNISFAKEGLVCDSLSMAQAAKNHGGIVIMQVEAVVDDLFDPKEVIIPHILVDYVIVCTDEKNQAQTFGTQFDETFIVNRDVKLEQEDAPLNDRKIIARRAALELDKTDRVLNYGIGIPEVIASVLNEENQEEYFTPTVEPGIIGGTPQGGMDFGVSRYPEMILPQNNQFDFYDGNGIDCAFLGLAQADRLGNLNVSKFGPKIAGAGGFINISQSAKKVIFCGTFMAGAKSHVENGNLVIDKEGHTKKFIEAVEQVTFSGKFAVDNNLKVLYITERAVFDLNYETSNLRLIEVAPGIDVEKDVIANMEFAPEIADEVKIMALDIFNEGKMNLVIK